MGISIRELWEHGNIFRRFPKKATSERTGTLVVCVEAETVTHVVFRYWRRYIQNAATAAPAASAAPGATART